MKVRLLVCTLILCLPTLAQALALGELQSRSALNEPFEARIPLVSVSAQELNSLSVRLAGAEAFERAGIPRAGILRKLDFVVRETESGPDYIRVYSTEPIREPFLNFLLEVRWANGRLYREYTVLLDPPVYANQEAQRRLASPAPAPQRERIVAPGPQPEETVQPIEDNQVVYNPTYTPPPEAPATTRATPPAPRRTITVGDQYGPVERGDTLWSLAKNLRPDDSVSIQQMMLALLRTNPEAFIDSNINGLKRGQILQLPELPEIRSLEKAEAFSLAKNQNDLWLEARAAMADAAAERSGNIATTTQTAADSPRSESRTTQATTTEADQAKLSIVTPGENGQAAGEGTSDETQALEEELVLARESLEALSQENAELTDQIAEADVIIEDMKRLIVLKENELAMLQEQVQTAEAKALAEEQADESGATGSTSEEEPVVRGDTESAADQGIMSYIPDALKNLPETLKNIPAAIGPIVNSIRNNLLYVGAAAGALILLLLLSIVRRRRANAPEKEASEAVAIASDSEANMTNLGPEMAESEAETALPAEMAEDEGDIELPGVAEEVKNTEDMAESTSYALPESSVEEGDEEEEDPLANVNVYLAYEQFGQAEDLVKAALEKEPENLEYHLKLLEVYYAANNKPAYESAAKDLEKLVDGKGDYWSMAQAMWKEISPNRELFAEPLEGEEEEAVASSNGGIVNIAGDSDEPTTTAVDFDFDLTSAAADESKGEVADITSEDLLDITSGTSGESLEDIDEDEDHETLDLTAGSGAEEDSDDYLDPTFSGIKPEPETEAEEELSFESDDEVFDVSGGNEDESAERAESGVSPADRTTEISSALDDEDLDIAFDKTEIGEEGKTATSKEDESSLDFSLTDDEGHKESAVGSDADSSSESGVDLDLSLDTDTETDNTVNTDRNLLDVSNNESEDLLDISSSTQDFGLEGEDDLLDVTSKTSTQSALDESSEKTTDQEQELDFDLTLEESDESSEDEKESEDTGESIESSSENNENAIDFDISGSEVSQPSINDAESPEDKSESNSEDMELSLEDFESQGEEDDSDVLTVSSGDDEDQDIASRLDLAKAYIELGDSDNAKSILDEVINQGNEEQRQQAEDLLTQI